MIKKHVHFIPQQEGLLLLWLTNLKEKIGTAGAAAGMPATEITELETFLTALIGAINLAEIKRNELKNALTERDELKKINLKGIMVLVNRLKNLPGYKASIGSELGLNSTSQVVDPLLLKPDIKAAVYPGKVLITFNLQLMNCITIYSRIKGSNGWDRLGNDYESPFEDVRPLMVANQPETREYQALYFNGRQDVGYASDIIEVTYGG
ncbi:hypothetical protein SAMN05421788_10565 [Filimonas lacunae]|uniref:Uncharacterized protein n=1 Tax=Filimonas lacunae TaxID=477680 RepID=A0A173MD18_9BACT|nr:hypothetical protein [Filimonas lacunae]BAV05483.1 hypothetical protein FLA_1490 [Filimonas lacunae]SIT20803.1 hypothetical protein SAMN05421788_10565 [Filimonas lacunae]